MVGIKMVIKQVKKGHIAVPYEFKNLGPKDSLIMLELGNNYISQISNLTDIRYTEMTLLDLSKNKIYEITGLETLVNLRSLNLSKNIIRVIQGLSKLEKLQILDLSNNKISKI